jgi:hypothetical protein
LKGHFDIYHFFIFDDGLILFKSELLNVIFPNMKKKPINLSLFQGVIVPGETYLLRSERKSLFETGSIENLYTIRSVDEMEAAIELEVDTRLPERFEYREFLEVRSLDDGRYMLRLWCHDKKRKRGVPFYLFLHRIPGAGEMLRRTKERIESKDME